MDSSLGTGFMAVFAVSGSVVFLAMQVHKRLLSKFMEKMEFEFRNSKGRMKEVRKKKVRFSDEVETAAAAANPNGGRNLKKHVARTRRYNDENLEGMPQNWQAMYREILQYRNLRGYSYI